MRAGWQTKKLGEVCQFVGGSQPPKAVFSKTEKTEYVRLIQIRDYKSDNHVVFIPRAQARRFCTATDIMIGRYGPPIFQILRGLEGAYNVALMKAVPDETKLSRDFLFYFLNSPKIQHHVISSSDRAAGQCGMNKETIEPFPILVPPLPEQHRIVAILDEAFDGIATAKANAEKNLENARALFESHLHAVFTQGGEGWVETTLDKISENLDSMRIPITKSKRKRGEYRYYGASGIVDYVDGYIFDGNTLLISEDGANLLARSTPIAFSVDGKYWVNNHAHILKFKHMATQRFVEFYLQSINLDEYITGAAQPKLNQKMLNLIPIPLPKAIEARAQIVEKIESLSTETQRLTAIYQRKLAALDELKKALLHKAFAGEL